MEYTRNLPDNLDSGYEQEDLDNYLIEHKRWKKKTLQARWLIGLLTVICCILIVILIVTYESGRKKKDESECSVKKPTKQQTTNSVIKFVHLSDIHYDPFYDKSISNSFFCRPQTANSTAKYVAQYGRIGCDSPALLLENSLDAIKNVSLEEEPSFILLTGRWKIKRCWCYSKPSLRWTPSGPALAVCLREVSILERCPP